MDAYAQLPAGSHARSYGHRETQQIYDFPLPLRYASGMWWHVGDSKSAALANDMVADGTCIIEVFPTIQGVSDLMKPLNLQNSVLYLIQKCVAGENPEGGIAEKLGKQSRGIKAGSKHVSRTGRTSLGIRSAAQTKRQLHRRRRETSL